MQLPQIKIFRNLVVPIVLGLLTWWGVDFVLQPREERLFLGRGTPYNYFWPFSEIWQDQRGQFIATSEKPSPSYEPTNITLFDFKNPQTTQTIAVPSATKKGAQLSESNPTRYILDENLPSNQPPEVIELHSPYPAAKLCRGWAAPEHVRRASYDYHTGSYASWCCVTTANTGYSSEEHWPTFCSNITLVVTSGEFAPMSMLRDLARKCNLEEWLWPPEVVYQACLVDENTKHVLWSHQTKDSDICRSFQAVAGITLQQPVNPCYAISHDGKSVLMLINKKDGTELSRWQIVLFSPGWARGTGLMVCVASFGFPFWNRRRKGDVRRSSSIET